MPTITQVIDRVYRDYLYAPDDQPSRTYLVTSISSTANTLTYDATTLSPDEEDLLSPGVIIECEQEQMLIRAVNTTTKVLTVRRGFNATVATAHATDAGITLSPTFSRQSAFDAVADNIVALFPQLYAVKTYPFTSTPNGYVEVPATVVSARSALLQYSSGYRALPVSFYDQYPPSSTGKSIHLRGAPSGTQGYLTYHAKFARPSDVTQRLFEDLGVRDEWERIVVVGAAAQLTSGRETETLTREYLTESLSAEAYPQGSTEKTRRSLMQQYTLWKEEARRNLQAEQRRQVVHHGLIPAMNRVV